MDRAIFVVHHTHEFNDDHEDVKLIGVFSSVESAEEAISKALLLPGFEDYPNGFTIDRYVLDAVEWTDGFVTVCE